MRDITLEETCYFNFTTRAFATGVPTTLAGTPVLSVLESNNATPITAGVSVSVDRASVTGLNQATVVATAANGYEAGKSYAVYISTGTVGGVSVIGEVVAQFTVQAAAAFTRLGAPAGASVSADVAAVKAETATILSDTNDIQTRIPAALVSGRIDASVGAMAADVMTAAAAAADLTTELQSGLATAANLATVAGYIDTEVAAIKAVTDALPNAGALTTIQADLDDIQTRLPAALVSGRMDSSVGAMAANVVTAAAIADAAIDRATFAADTGLQSVRSNTAQAGASTSITLDASASATTDFYINHLVLLTGGTGAGQARFITAYNGTTKVATVSAWATNPDNTSTFALLAGDAVPGATAPTAAQVADAVWDELLSGHAVSGSTGEALSAAGSAGDPWITALPGAYSAGQAGYIVGTNVNATISSRASQTSVDTVDDLLDTEVAAIKADTAAILIDTAEIGAAGAGLTALATAANLATVAGYLDTEIAAIKAKTDNLPAAPAATGDIPSAATIADAVWDEATSGHVSAGTTGLALGNTDLRGSRTVVRGTVSSTSPSTTQFTPSALSPAGVAADQFKGRIIVFDNDTTTTALRGQATDITANTAAGLPVFTYTALTTAPQASDTFSIV